MRKDQRWAKSCIKSQLISGTSVLQVSCENRNVKTIVLLGLIFLGPICLVPALHAQEVVLSGVASCAKCELELVSKCQAAITVTGTDGKTEVILAEQNVVALDFHSVICLGTVKVKAEGVIAEQNGKKVITLTKIAEAR
jgi:hypothetical protein